MSRHRFFLLFVGCGLALASAALLGWGRDAHQWELMGNTVTLAVRACAISLPVGAGLAFLLVRTDLPGRRAAMVLLGAMLLMPLYLHAAAWDAGFGQLGWYSLFQGKVDAPWLNKMNAAVWVHAMAAVPWVVLIVGAGLRYVEAELEEWALLCGSLWQVLWRVTLPRTAAAVAVAGMWVFVWTAGEMTATDLYRVRTYAEVLYTGFALGDDLTTSLGTVLPGILGGMALVFVAAFSISSIPSSIGSLVQPPLSIRLGRAKWYALAIVLLVLFLIAGVPLGNLIYKAGMTVEQIAGERVRHWSPRSFLDVLVFSPWQFRREFGWTTLVAGSTAIVATIVALPLAWLARRGGWESLPAVSLAAVSLALPGPLIGLGVVWLLNRDNVVLIWLYDDTVFAPVLASMVRVLPYSLLMCWFAFRPLDQDVLDAAACDGAGPWRRFWWIVVPQRAAALTAAWLASFAIAAGDLACTILVAPPRVSTVPIRTFGLLHAGVDDQVAGICLTLVIAFALITTAVALLLRPRGGRKCKQ